MTAAQFNFDVSDVDAPREDKLDDVLAIAAEVLAELGEDEASRHTRIGRLAQWLVANVGGEPFSTKRTSPSVEIIHPHQSAYPLVRVGSVFGIEKPTKDAPNGTAHIGFAVGYDAARAFAVALLRATENVER